MFLEAGLLTRRSVRQFEKDREIPQSDIDDILKIAMYAPSARNTQPWEFVVVKDKKMRDKIAEVHPYAKFFERRFPGDCRLRGYESGNGTRILGCRYLNRYGKFAAGMPRPRVGGLLVRRLSE